MTNFVLLVINKWTICIFIIKKNFICQLAGKYAIRYRVKVCVHQPCFLPKISVLVKSFLLGIYNSFKIHNFSPNWIDVIPRQCTLQTNLKSHWMMRAYFLWNVTCRSCSNWGKQCNFLVWWYTHIKLKSWLFHACMVIHGIQGIEWNAMKCME